MEVKRILVGPLVEIDDFEPPTELLQTNCYLLIDGDQILIVDPGDDEEKIIEEINATGATPIMIVTTNSDRRHRFAAPFLAKKLNLEVLSNDKRYEALGFDKYIKEGDILEVGMQKIRVVETPGTSDDAICLFGENFVLSGDIFFDGEVGTTRTPDVMEESLEKLDKLISEGTRIYPGHGESFTYKKGELLNWIDVIRDS